jgi:Beta protein
MSFGHNHYVPILKTKAGEIWSLLHLRDDSRPFLTPLLEIHKHKNKKDKPPKPMPEHVNEVCDSIEATWGNDSLFFLDTEWINHQHGAATAVKTAFDACRERNLKAVPVVAIDYDEDALNEIKSALHLDGRGYMLRLDADDASAQAAIGGVTGFLGLPKSDVHLLLDYKHHPMNLSEDVPKLASLSQWLTFSASSGAFPKTISTLPRRTWIDISRHDWNKWEQSILEGNLARKPTFSDYGTRCPGPPSGGGDPIVHLRYTKELTWLVYIDGTLQSGDAPKMPGICRKLIAKPEYDGREFSEGDEQIWQIAQQDTKRGGATQWLQWSLNHHLEFAEQQLRELASI